MFGYVKLMGREKTVSDADVFHAVRQLLVAGGEKAVSFASVSRAIGLAGPTLVQRFGTRAHMVQAAQMAAWDNLDAATAEAIARSDPSPKGAQDFLKALVDSQDESSDLAVVLLEFRNPALRQRAKIWRRLIESELGQQLGGGAKGREAASILFAAWQGQIVWRVAGGKSFKMKDAVKRLT